MKPPRGVLVVGNAVFDFLVRPVDRLAWGATTWVETILPRLGGNGANTSYTLAKMGAPVRLMAWLGNDPPGQYLLDVLTAAGVDMRWVRRSTAATAATVALVASSGDRLFLHCPGVSAEASATAIEFTPDLLAGVSHLHLANPFALPRLRHDAAECLRRARQASLSTSLDTGWDALDRWLDDLGPCLPFVDLLFTNADEARMLTGRSTPAQAAAELRRLGARTVIVKLGAEGCLVLSPRRQTHVPAVRVNIVDTTGAGDCFVGAFLAALHQRRSLVQAARIANSVGALVVQHLGGAEALKKGSA